MVKLKKRKKERSIVNLIFFFSKNSGFLLHGELIKLPERESGENLEEITD